MIGYIKTSAGVLSDINHSAKMQIFLCAQRTGFILLSIKKWCAQNITDMIKFNIEKVNELFVKQ